MADRIIDEIKDKLDIVDVLSGYIQLKRAGTNFKATCPFHQEKSASLMVSPAKQIWHCFGCGEGGDVFGFVTRHENIDFKEALKLLADRVGVQLPQYQGRTTAQEDLKDQIFRINKFAAAFYHQSLQTKGGSIAREYLQKRGLHQATIDAWQIGYAPDDFHALELALIKKGVSKDLLVQSGVSVKSDSGQIFDRFRNRVIFPIFDYAGEVAGFTARIIGADAKSAKYINSPETPAYNKSVILFGLNFAKTAIRKSDYVVVVEGQVDCISAHEAGFTNTVATSGTALTERQLKLLARLTKNIKFCFDADTAGQAASRKAGELALSLGFAVKVIVLPQGKDPDELIRSDVSAWTKAVSDAVWFIDFYITQGITQYPVNSVEQKKYVATTVIPLLQFVTDPLERDHYIRKITEQFGVSERSVRQSLQGRNLVSSSSLGGAKKQAEPVVAPPQMTSSHVLEMRLLGSLLSNQEFLEFYLEDPDLEDFTDGEIRKLIEVLLMSGQKTEIMQSTLAKEAVFMVESGLDESDGLIAAPLKELQKNLYILRLSKIKRNQEQLSAQIKLAEAQGSPGAQLKALHIDFANLSKQRLMYENKINTN